MLLSVCVYTSLAAILFALGWHVWKREERLKAATGRVLPFWSWEIIASILIFAVVAGARYHTGFDHAMYLHQYVSYQKYGFFTRDFEPLFMWVTQLMAGAHVHYFFYFAFWAGIEIMALYYALNKYKHLLPWVSLMLVFGPFYLHLMNTMRQGVVECFLPLLLVMLSNRKYLLFCGVILLLSLVHETALLLIVLGLVRFKWNSSVFRKCSVFLFLLATAVGSLPFWLELCRHLTHILMNSSLFQYGNEFSINEHHFSVAFGPVRMFVLCCQLIVLWLSKETLTLFYDNEWMQLIAITAVVFVVGTALMCNTTNFYQRPFELFGICFVVLMAATVSMLLKYDRKILAFIVIAINLMPLMINLVKATLWPSTSNLPTLYHFFFTHYM